MNDCRPRSFARVQQVEARWRRALRTARIAPRTLRRRWRRDGERGATTLEWLLLVAAVALPSYAIIRLGLELLYAHYQLVTTLNGLPFP